MSYRAHRGLVGLLLLVATLASIAAAGAYWIDTQVVNTARWTLTSRRLIADPVIRLAVSDFTVRHAFAGIDSGLTRVLPGVVAQVAQRDLRRAAGGVAERVLSRTGGRAAWVDANRQAVSGLLAAVTHPRRGETVVLQLTPLLSDVVSGFARSPVVRAIPGSRAVLSAATPNAGHLTILTAPRVRDARVGVRILRVLAWALPLGALVAFLLAWALARRWRVIVLSRIGYALLIAGGVVYGLRAGLQFPLADAVVHSGADRAAVRATWLITSAPLHTEALGLLVAGALVTVGSWLARGIAR